MKAIKKVNPSTKVKELCEFIWYLEVKYNLFDLKIKDIFIWEYIRMQFYYALAVKIGILTPQTKTKTLKNRFVHFIKSFSRLLSNNLWTLKPADAVFFSHTRSVKVNGEYIDIYSEYLIREHSKTQKVIDFEGDYQGTHMRKRNHDVHILDWVLQLVYVKYFFLRKKKVLTVEEGHLIKNLENEIFQKYRVAFDLQNLIESKVKLFAIYYDIYYKIFSKVNPSTVYLTTAYYYAPIIKAAKDQHANVVELQHGIITKYHLGYSFPFLNKPLHYYPDQLMVWNDNWKRMAVYPIKEQHIIVDSFRYMEEEKMSFADVEKIENTFLVLSQAAISSKISKKILDHIDFFKHKKIIYKLHPGEFEIWQQNKNLIILTEQLDVEIKKNEEELYLLMAKSEYQIGVFSTALYEGVEFGCKTILLDVDGIEYMEDFILINNPLILR